MSHIIGTKNQQNNILNMFRFCYIYTKNSMFLACGKTILVWFLGLKVTWRSTWKRSGCYCFTLYYLIRVNFMLTSALKCNISLRLCFSCVKQPNLTSHCDISNAVLIPSSKWKTVWTQAWKKLIKYEYLCLHSLPNDLPVETSYQWLLLTLPRLSEVVTSCSATIFSSALWVVSTCMTFKYISNSS